VTGIRASSPWPALGFFVAMAAAGPLLDSFWQSLLTIVFFYAFMGLTWNLMMSAGLLSLGHGLFLGLGAYATAVFTATGGLSPWISILIGAAISAVAGSAIAWIGGRFSVRGVQFALLTIAFAELARVLFDNWDFVGSTGGFFLKAINPDTNRPLLTLRGGTLFFYLAFVLITAAAYFLSTKNDPPTELCKTGLPELLRAQHGLSFVQKDISSHDAAEAFDNRHTKRVAGLTGRKEDIRLGEQARLGFVGVLEPWPVPGIIIGRSRQPRDRCELVGKKLNRRRRAVTALGFGNDEKPECGPIRSLKTRPPSSTCAIDGIHLEERAVVVSHIQAVELLVAPEHRCQHDI